MPCILGLATMTGFMILNCILGGQTLSAVSGGDLSWTWAISLLFDSIVITEIRLIELG